MGCLMHSHRAGGSQYMITSNASTPDDTRNKSYLRRLACCRYVRTNDVRHLRPA